MSCVDHVHCMISTILHTCNSWKPPAGSPWLPGLRTKAAGRRFRVPHICVILSPSRSGEWRNGRRAGFRCQCPSGRGGSSPPSPTAVVRESRSPESISGLRLFSLFRDVDELPVTGEPGPHDAPHAHRVDDGSLIRSWSGWSTAGSSQWNVDTSRSRTSGECLPRLRCGPRQRVTRRSVRDRLMRNVGAQHNRRIDDC